jgi:miniconductance mechanosensitive channel
MLFRTEISQLLGLDPQSFLLSGLEACGLFALVMSVYWLLKNSVVRLLRNWIYKSDFEGLKLISRTRVLRNFTLLGSFILLYSFKGVFLNKTIAHIYDKGIYAIMVVMIMLLYFSVANAMIEVYSNNAKVMERYPVKPIFQITKVAAFLIALILLVSNMLDKTPVYILSGVGALSAVIIFIFKDLIQSLVASFQITSHKSVKVGDWIEIPKYMVNGEVQDISLNLITVKNFDNTMTVIPTNCLLTESFKNWASIRQSGRRIMRSMSMDLTSIRQLSQADIERLKKVRLLREYLESKEAALKDSNDQVSEQEFKATNGMMLTNIGTFRKYVEFYLKSHPDILPGQLLLVRQLDSSAHGMPLEIYCFTDKTQLIDFEAVQADIFDHLYSVVGLFDLRVFQSPSASSSSAAANGSSALVD